MKTQGEIESAISVNVAIASRKTWTAAPAHVHAHLIDDLIVVKLKGVMTAAEQHLVKKLEAGQRPRSAQSPADSFDRDWSGETWPP
jgi:uncharacterized protein YbcI